MNGASTRRRLIIEAIAARLANIQVAKGFNTDAGLQLFLGETPTLGPDDPLAAIALVIGDDESGHQGENVVSVLALEVQASVRTDREKPLLSLEAAIEDIKVAVEDDSSENPKTPRSLGGLALPRGLERGKVRVLERVDGSDFLGMGVGYRVSYAEKWGRP